MYGTRKSLRSHDHERLAKSFEPYAAAKRKAEVQDPMKSRKKVCGSFEKMNFDKEALLPEVTSYPDDEKVNFTKLTSKYNVLNKSGKVTQNDGQIIKEFLKENDVNISRFTNYNGDGRKISSTENPSIRKRKLKLSGDISMPSDDSAETIRSELKQDITDGKYLIGEPIIPKEYTKLALKDGEIQETTFSVYGRKIPLTVIRRQRLEKERCYMREIPDFKNLSNTEIENLHNDIIQRQFVSRSESELALSRLYTPRHLQIWHDNSTIL